MKLLLPIGLFYKCMINTLIAFVSFIIDIEIPEKVRLPMLLKTPIFNTGRPPKYSKRIDLIRGHEQVHTELNHNQYGIIVSI